MELELVSAFYAPVLLFDFDDLVQAQVLQAMGGLQPCVAVNAKPHKTSQ